MHALKPVKKLKRNNEYLNVYSLIVKLPYRQLPLREFFYAVRIQVWWYINMFHWMLCPEVSRSWIIYKAKHDLVIRQLYTITILNDLFVYYSFLNQLNWFYFETRCLSKICSSTSVYLPLGKLFLTIEFPLQNQHFLPIYLETELTTQAQQESI